MNVLITGVSSGIGKALLKKLDQSDLIKTIFACSSSVSQVRKTGKITYIPLDFLVEDQLRNVKSVILNTPIHVLINNAGYLESKSILGTTSELMKKIYAINTFGPFHLTQELLPNLKEAKGHVINIGSMGGVQGSAKFPGLSAYSSSKAALANLSECMAVELKEDHVTVNCLCLGAVHTEMLNKAFPNYHANVSPQEVADYIFSFATSPLKLFNGKVIPVSSDNP